MDVVRYTDAAAFRRDGAPLLLADAARNNLPLSILQVLLDQPEIYPSFRLWMAVRDGRPLGLDLQTDPHPVVLAEPLEDGAIEALAEAIVGDRGSVPGVVANLPWADRFAERVTELTGRSAERILSEGVWEATAITEAPTPRGVARDATPDDRDLLHAWMRAFAEEALPPEHPSREDPQMDLEIDLRLAGRGGGYRLWEDGAPVSLSGFRTLPGVGSRIGPVYTPPAHRRQGYATGLVAELSASRLELGDAACYLFTDLANPTSNAIYARIGYVRVCDAVQYVFGP